MRRPLTFAPLSRDLERILVTALCPIGDTLLLTPALALLRGRYPAAHITVVLSPSNEGILLDNPSVDARLLVPERGEEAEATRFARGVRRLSEEHPDLIINFSTLGTWVARAAALRAPTLGLAMPWLWGLLGTGAEGSNAEVYRNRHAVDQYFKVIEPIAPTPSDPQARTPRFYMTPDSRRTARALLVADGVRPGDTLVTMHVGGDGFDGRKRWAPERFARVANYLVERFDARIVLVGGKADIPMSNTATALIRGHVHSLAGKTPLNVTGALIEASSLFIGNDSCPLHIAAAVGTPAVGVFGPSDWTEFHPVGAPGYRSRVVHSDLPCAPCFRFVGNKPLWQINTCYSYACLKTLDARRVMEAAVELLQGAVTEETREPATAPEKRY